MVEISSLLIVLLLCSGFLLGLIVLWLIMRKKSANPEESAVYRQVLSDREELRTQLESYRQKEIEWSSEKASLSEKNKVLEESIRLRQEELEKSKTELKKEFELLAHRIFEQKSSSFEEKSKSNLKQLLEPFDKNINEFKKDVKETYEKSWKEREQLIHQLKDLKELNQTMTREANELTRALKGENKTQGNWGEMILERILENSGLEKGREYEVQRSAQLDSGKRIQPDVIVHLPDDKHIIIDSKVSLKSYELYFNAEAQEERDSHLKEHILSLRNHIKNLHGKSYTEAKSFDTPDFVLLFVPIEASFGMAIDADKDLFDYAWSRNIVIVTPSTLLATLRTIASIWKHEKTHRNAAEIAEKAGKLYDKFAVLAEGLEKTQKQFKTASNSLDEAVNRISEGRGNLINRVEELKKMGASTAKSLKDSAPELYRSSEGLDDGADEEV
jgi:DNA recombination protein RmuC